MNDSPIAPDDANTATNADAIASTLQTTLQGMALTPAGQRVCDLVIDYIRAGAGSTACKRLSNSSRPSFTRSGAVT
jgi:hypothetical protein